MLPRLALIAFSIAQPFLIQEAIDFVEDGTMTNRYGYGLIGAFGLTYLGIAVRIYSLFLSFPKRTSLMFASDFDGVVPVYYCPRTLNDPRGSDQHHI